MEPSLVEPLLARSIDDFRSERLGLSFYQRDALDVAPDLLGTFVGHRTGSGEFRAARIVETEAYRGPTDGACHARAGLTKRTRTLLGPPAHAYVFLIYGMYDCFNIVCFGEGKGHAVLVRAGEPVHGIPPGLRTDGPGRLTRAMGITRVHDTWDLTSSSLYVAPRARRPRIDTTARVGVGYAGKWAEEPWRFLDTASKYVSRPAARFIGQGLTVRSAKTRASG